MLTHSWLAKDEPYRTNRAATEPIDFAPSFAGIFGPGLGRQPSHELLLQENLGVADIATRAIANRVASLEPLVQRQTVVQAGTTKFETVDDHPLKKLLDRPHPNLTMSQMLRLTGQYMVTVGEGYWLKVGNRFGMPARLHVIPAGRVRPIVQDDVVAFYRIRDGKGEQFNVPPEVIIRFYFPDPESPFESEGYLGPNAVAHDALKFQTEHIKSLYKNNAIPPAVLESSPEATALQDDALTRFNEKWKQRFHGRMGSDRGIPAWLPTGWKIVWAAIQSGAEITPLLDYFTREQLMNFGVPRSVLGEVVSGDRSSAETNQFVFDMHTILPIARVIENALTLQLAADFGDDISVVFDDFVSRDKEFDLKREQSDLDRKVRSINEIRTDREDDPSPWGDLPVGTVADVPYSGEQPIDPFDEEDETEALGDDEGSPIGGSEDEDEDLEEDDGDLDLAAAYGGDTSIARAHERARLYERLYGGLMWKRLRGIVRKQEKTVIKRWRDQNPRSRADIEQLFRAEEWRELFVRRIEALYRVIFARAGSDAMKAVGQGDKEFLFTTEVIGVIEEQGSLLSQRTSETTKARLDRELIEGIQAGESVDQIAKRLRGVFAGRRRNTRTIARTEVLRASQSAQVEGFKSSGVVAQKRWNTSRDGAVRDAHAPMDGIEVPIDSDFVVGGEVASAPGDSRLSPRNLINCRCFVSPVV